VSAPYIISTFFSTLSTPCSAPCHNSVSMLSSPPKARCAFKFYSNSSGWLRGSPIIPTFSIGSQALTLAGSLAY
jgi:hypothetical protein